MSGQVCEVELFARASFVRAISRALVPPHGDVECPSLLDGDQGEIKSRGRGRAVSGFVTITAVPAAVVERPRPNVITCSWWDSARCFHHFLAQVRAQGRARPRTESARSRIGGGAVVTALVVAWIDIDSFEHCGGTFDAATSPVVSRIFRRILGNARSGWMRAGVHFAFVRKYEDLHHVCGTLRRLPGHMPARPDPMLPRYLQHACPTLEEVRSLQRRPPILVGPVTLSLRSSSFFVRHFPPAFHALSVTDRTRPHEIAVVFNARNWTSVPAPLAGVYSLEEYREYLVNHEMGHVLGIGHDDPRVVDAVASSLRDAGITTPFPCPIMIQQTKGLPPGTVPNTVPFPTATAPFV